MAATPGLLAGQLVLSAQIIGVTSDELQILSQGLSAEWTLLDTAHSN